MPVINRCSRGEQVNASLRFSFWWPSLHVLHLRQNMRVRCGQENQDFAEWIARMSYERSLRGKTDLPSVIRNRFFDRDDAGKIDDTNGLHALCEHVYPAAVLADGHQNPEAFRQRAILTLRNDTAAEINAHVQRGIHDEEQIFYAINSTETNVDEDYRLSDEFLQSIECSSLSPNILRLKIGSPVMLIRNLYQKEGLCNGSRLTITHMAHRSLEARMLGGPMDGELRLIPGSSYLLRTIHKRSTVPSFLLAFASPLPSASRRGRPSPLSVWIYESLASGTGSSTWPSHASPTSASSPFYFASKRSRKRTTWCGRRFSYSRDMRALALAEMNKTSLL